MFSRRLEEQSAKSRQARRGSSQAEKVRLARRRAKYAPKFRRVAYLIGVQQQVRTVVDRESDRVS
jgi:hypothetical protein